MEDSTGLQRHVLIAANPKSGAQSKQNRVAELRQGLLADSFEVEICSSLDDLAVRSRDLYSQGVLKTVIAAGGDGTVSAVTNLIPPQVPVAVFPMGTENLLAKHLQATCDVTQMRRALKAWKIRNIDVGRANGRLFLVMVGCGFDAEVVRRLHRLRTGHIRRWSYAKPILDVVRTYAYPEIEVEFLDQLVDESRIVAEGISSHTVSANDCVRWSEEKSVRAAWLFAFNLPRYAANLPFCPQAVDTDGKIDVCAFRRGGFWPSMWYFWKLWRGQHRGLTEFRHVRSSRFRLTSSAEVPYQLDGDPGGILPLEIEVLPARLALVMPAEL